LRQNCRQENHSFVRWLKIEAEAWALLVSALHVVWLMWTVRLIARTARKGVLFLDVKKMKKGGGVGSLFSGTEAAIKCFGR
jgi:hypothetical protein